MGFANLFVVALMPVLKVILMTGVGFFIASDRIKLLGSEPNRHLNNIVFYVLSPALAASSSAETVTFQSFMTLWFMPLNLLLAYIFGSILAWLLIKITKTPGHLQAIVIGCCSAGNVGTLTLIMIPAVCEESNNPFGDPSVCSLHARSYASLSLAIGAIYMWSYVYGIIRLYVNKTIENDSTSETAAESCTELDVLPSIDVDGIPLLTTSFNGTIAKLSAWKKIMRRMKSISEKVDLKKVFAPTAIAAIVGFIIGIASPIRKLLIGNEAPLRVVDSSAYILGETAIPCMTLIMGGNLSRGLNGSDVSRTVIIGIIGVRNILLPLIGIGVVKAALHLGLIASENKLYHFVLLLQFAVPPAISVGTMTQKFQLGQCETSVIMLWTYVIAAFTLTIWSTLFMWILA
ncbi:Auxin efflux carrier family protein isoform 1 [Hibiscus syriacus]|uniref:Auxin efflux carrier family protein isoform 1 n=1 Tax=Hibiscus syriacus TaxID=106335 RepID=A0A6A2YYK9_HIBSY|nr:protein PIN-LIKES 3-like [Hibiscus syriacus]KAE8684349.1 Auxin efflux carrier family protein isoform 1 [Hibiscus syriacus]